MPYRYDDPKVDVILDSLATIESKGSGDYSAQNPQTKAYGRYQFMPETWDIWSKRLTNRYIGKPVSLDQTEENQDLVARFKVATLLNAGKSPEQVASIWYTGTEKWEGKKGVNPKYGNTYDAPGYVSQFKNLYNSAMKSIGPSEAHAATIPKQNRSDWEVDETWNPQAPTDEQWEVDEAWKPQPKSPSEPIDLTGIQGSTDVSQVPLQETGQGMLREAAPYVGPALPFAGAMVGGAVTAPANLVAPGVSEVAGATGGYLAGKQLENRLYEMAGIKQPQGISGAASEFAQDIPEAGITALSGPIGGKVIEGAVGAAGKVARPIIGSLTGKGTGAVEEAIKSGTSTGMSRNPFKTTTDFDRALRGQITSEEVVGNAQSALNTIKEQRGDAYRSILAQIQTQRGQIDTMPIKTELTNLAMRYNVKLTPTGDLDFSRIAMGKQGRKDIRDIIETVRDWGSRPDDNTALGLDALKRQLDDFWSESKQARAFVTAIRNKVKDTIVKNVPEYAEMTKGYSEATTLIKDIESGLMMRKQGMSGRITADQTLRRLNSAMRANFALRRELVNALSAQTGEDIGAQIAGQAMNDVLPSGLMRIGAAGIGAAEMLRIIDPKYLAILAASSPRVQGEFLRLFGKGLAEIKGTAPITARAFAAAGMEGEQ